MADLRGANLERANLSKAVLRGANLRGANLNNASLASTDFQETDLRGVSFLRAYFESTDVTDAKYNKETIGLPRGAKPNMKYRT